jgi:FkbM family methyltransferase
MRLRGIAKKLLFGYIPKRFRYYGETVHFPAGSHIFERACAEGIYERDTTNLILSLVQPGTTYFDIGANIGLLSIPVLAMKKGVDVVSVEASPHTLPALRRTHSASPYQQRWTVVGAAVGDVEGEAEFWSGGGAWGAFDGLRDTGRGGPKHSVRVPALTIDQIWRDKGCPPVSLIKMDIEGAESLALLGARDAISHTRPPVVMEWSEQNLPAYGIAPIELLRVCADLGYLAYAFPSLVAVNTNFILSLAMRETETFILAPRQ